MGNGCTTVTIFSSLHCHSVNVSYGLEGHRSLWQSVRKREWEWEWKRENKIYRESRERAKERERKRGRERARAKDKEKEGARGRVKNRVREREQERECARGRESLRRRVDQTVVIRLIGIDQGTDCSLQHHRETPATCTTNYPPPFDSSAVILFLILPTSSLLRD